MDHAATTPVHPRVAEVMLPYLSGYFGNPSSIHSFGRKTRAVLDEARRRIAATVGTDVGQLVFTSGGTEADNLALVGVALANQEKGKHIITSTIEHHAVLHTCLFLEQLGFEVTYLAVNEYGQVRLKDVRENIREDTILVSIMYGNNEVGSIQPIQQIGELLREKEILFHTDAVQVFGMERIQFDALPVDLLSVSSHKINGPKGIGFLYADKNVRLKPILHGGAQERNRRAGTENIAAIIGFAEAVELAYGELKERHRRYISFRDKMLEVLDMQKVAYHVNGHRKDFLAHILNISFNGVKADAMLMNLDIEGIAASSGSACTAGSLQPSHVLESMYPQEDERIYTAIRFSFGLGNTIDQVEKVANTASNIVHRLNKEGYG